MELLFYDWVYVVGLAFLATICTFGTLYEGFDDNLGERIGMSAMVIGSIAEIHAVWVDSRLDSPIRLLVFGIIVFTASTIYPVVRNTSCGSSKP